MFQKIDMYGSVLTFTLNRKSSFNSMIGGVFTVLTIMMYLFLIFLLAKDFYLKINPRVTSDDVYITDIFVNNYTFTNRTFLFAIDNLGRLDNPNLFKYSIMFVKDSEDGYGDQIELDFITCDEIQYWKLFYSHKIAKNSYCIDFTKIYNQNMTNIHFSDGVLSNYLEFTVKFNYDYLNILNNTYKNEILSEEYIFNYYFPKLSFSPNNYEDPLSVQLDFSTFYLKNNTKYISELRYSESRLEQEENFLFDSITEMDWEIHISNNYENYRSKHIEDHELAIFQLCLDGLYYNKYRRIYKKVPEILAQVIGIMQPVKVLFSLLVNYFTKLHLDNYLVKNFLCYFTQEQNTDDKIIWKFQNYKEFKNMFKNVTDNEDIKSKSNFNFSKLDENSNKNHKYLNTEIVCHKNIAKKSDNNKLNNVSTVMNNNKHQILLSNNDFINEINIELFNLENFKSDNNYNEK